MKIGNIIPCICIDKLPETGDSSFKGMPQLKVSNGEWFTHYCPVCGRGGCNSFRSAYLALKDWNEMQERLWKWNDGKPLDDAPKPEPVPDPRDGYADWHKTHQLLHLPEGEHFKWKHEECRIRSDGKAVLIYDFEYNDWLAPGYPELQLEKLLEHPEEIQPLPFECWHVEADEPTWVWSRYVYFKFRKPTSNSQSPTTKVAGL